MDASGAWAVHCIPATLLQTEGEFRIFSVGMELLEKYLSVNICIVQGLAHEQGPRSGTTKHVLPLVVLAGIDHPGPSVQVTP